MGLIGGSELHSISRIIVSIDGSPWSDMFGQERRPSRVEDKLPMIPAADLPALFADPHAAFRTLRAEHPVVEVMPRLYLVLRHSNVMEATMDERLRQMRGSDYVQLAGIPEGRVAEFLSRIMLFDPSPSHPVKRRPFNTALSFPKINALAGNITGIAEAQVAALPAETPIDLVGALSARLPTAVIAGLLGLDIAEDELDWTAERVNLLSLSLAAVYPMDRHGEIEAALEDLIGLVSREMEARRRVGRDDLLTALVDERGALSPEDLVMQIVGMVMGGSHTILAALPLAASYILPRWDEAQPVLEDAIREVLRLDSPIGTLPLWTDEDWPVPGGEDTIPGGSMVGLSILSAMRDPEVFEDPEAFQPVRAPSRELVFGTGAHRCMGSRIAILEIAATLTALQDRFCRIEMPEAAVLEGFGGVRKAAPFPVVLHRRPVDAAR